MTLEDLEILRDLMDSAAQRGLDVTSVRWKDFEATFSRSEVVQQTLPAPMPVQLPLPGLTTGGIPGQETAYDHPTFWAKKPSFK